MNIDANFDPPNLTTCQSHAQISCLGSQNINQYTTCWVPAMEHCGYKMAEDKFPNNRGDGECYIEEELTTEVVCFLSFCENVSYMKYNLVC